MTKHEQASFFRDKTVLVGVSGGIAAYKAADLVSKLVRQGANVNVVMTVNASEFVAPLTFETLSGNPVIVDMFAERMAYRDLLGPVAHISLSERTDFAIIAPATANIIGKIASGLADDALTTAVISLKCPVFIAPAMNDNMWHNPIVKDNVARLRKYGYLLIGPSTGRLACGTSGEGRMTEPIEILSFIEEYFAIKGNKFRKRKLKK